MKTTLLLTATLTFLAGAAVLVAQPPERRITTVERNPGLRPAPARHRLAFKPVSRDLRLRSGATATGLTGFYDYQSNGASPGYIEVRRGSPDVIVTTSMIAPDGSSLDNANASRRVGYAYSADGGATWTSTPSIFELRLGFPCLRLGSGGLPYIAAHGDLGDGDRSFLFQSSAIGNVGEYFPLGELPLTTESGREGGVAWPTFVLTKDGTKAVVFGSYSNDVDQPEAPLQVATMSLVDGSTQPRWRNLTDSALSVTSGGRVVAAVSASGRIGVAWYRYQNGEADDAWGVYYSESTDDGATWKAPVAVLTGEKRIDELGVNGDPDTLTAGANLDLAFRGDEPQLVFTGAVNGLLQFENVLFWSPSTGLDIIAMSHQVPGLGAYSIPLDRRQQNMEAIAYPTISIGDDMKHVVVAFSAVAQTLAGDGSMAEDAVSADGFEYYRIWGVGSADGGASWGQPFIVQDFAEKATDSASIEYPSVAEHARVSAGALELPISFQARRYPGMYIYTGSGESKTVPGPITECSQYYQNFTVTPAMFRSSAAASDETTSSSPDATIVPNRTATSAALDVTLRTATTLDVSIVDALGRTVARPLESERRAAGVAHVQLDASALPAGLYHCVVRHDHGVITRRLEVVR
jgi:hypothetical protein